MSVEDVFKDGTSNTLYCSSLTHMRARRFIAPLRLLSTILVPPVSLQPKTAWGPRAKPFCPTTPTCRPLPDAWHTDPSHAPQHEQSPRAAPPLARAQAARRDRFAQPIPRHETRTVGVRVLVSVASLKVTSKTSRRSRR